MDYDSLFLLLFIFIGILLALAIAAAVNRGQHRGRRPDADPYSGACGACGYSTKGVSTFNCPECGADLRIVGITPPTLAPPSTAGNKAVLVAVIAVLAIIVLGGLFSWVSMGNSAPAPMPTQQKPMTAPPSDSLMTAPAPPDAVDDSPADGATTDD